MELLRKFAAEERSTVLIVTHDHRVLRSANRIVTMNFGRIVSNVLKEESTKICEFLTRVDMFKALPPATLAGIADKMSRERYRAGAVLFRQGDPGEKFYVVRRGVAEVFGDDKGGSFRKFLKAGESFGEIALLKDVPRTATVVANEDLEVYSLGKADFKAAVDQSESLNEQLWKVFFQRQ
jgi:putative ABC transport system ATP-binding protein